MIKPISPSEAKSGKHIPSFVFEAFNKLIREKFDGQTAVIKQSDVVDLITQYMAVPPEQNHNIFTQGWLNVEGAYEAEGWIVDYDKPAYCETYPATFTFKAKK